MGALAALTGVATLSQLTLLPLHGCIAPKGLMATQARWCPHCLAEDLAEGRQPYFRLAWDIGSNKVCARHATGLIACCPHCHASNVRHSATFVVPGWCTACGHFLGASELDKSDASPDEKHALETEQAMRIGQLLACTSQPPEAEDVFIADSNKIHQAIEQLIREMDGGVAAHFAKRLGVPKSTVHYWRTKHTPLTMDALVRISLHCNVSMPALIDGELENWNPPPIARQLAFRLQYPPTTRCRPQRQHDWPTIRQQLQAELMCPEPRSVAETAKALDIDVRHLYIQATDQARRLGERYVQHLRMRALSAQAALHELRGACHALHTNGQGITPEEVERMVGARTINSTRNLYSVLSDLAGQAANDESM
ncbi:TniQ family protein [Castellaniella sp. WN]